MAMDPLYTEALKELEQAKARISALQDDVEIHRTAEDMQIALRQKAEQERDVLAAYIERLTGDVLELIDKSDGVAGLHLNGDMAPWSELTQGGRFEGWLMSLDEAPATSLARRDALTKADAFAEAAAICRKVKAGQDGLAWMYKEVSPDGEEYIGDYGIPYGNKALGAQHCVDDLQREEKRYRRKVEAEQ